MQAATTARREEVVSGVGASAGVAAVKTAVVVGGCSNNSGRGEGWKGLLPPAKMHLPLLYL